MSGKNYHNVNCRVGSCQLLYFRKEMRKDVKKTNDGVKIIFSGVVERGNIVKMVENCTTGRCECMSDSTKKKIKDMRVTGVDGKVELNLTGAIAKKEIEEALAKSKVINK